MLQTAIDQATYKISENPAAQAIPTLTSSCGPVPLPSQNARRSTGGYLLYKIEKTDQERRLIFRQERGFRSLTMGKKGLRFY